MLKEVDRKPTRVIFVTFVSSLHRTMQRWYGNKLMTTSRAQEKRLCLESNSQKKSLMTSVMSRLGSWKSWWTRLPNLSKKTPFLKTQNTKAERFWTFDLMHTEPFWNFLFAGVECYFCGMMAAADAITCLKVASLTFYAIMSGKMESLWQFYVNCNVFVFLVEGGDLKNLVTLIWCFKNRRF